MSGIELTEEEKVSVMRGLDLLKAQAAKLEKSAKNIEVAGVTKKITEFYKGLEDLKHKFL